MKYTLMGTNAHGIYRSPNGNDVAEHAPFIFLLNIILEQCKTTTVKRSEISRRKFVLRRNSSGRVFNA